MRLLQCVVLLQFVAVGSFGQSAQPSKQSGSFDQPEALVRSLYTEVVVRHSHDIPADAEMKIFAPYLSQGLLHKIDLAKACSADWDRQNPEPHWKVEMAFSHGLLSGESAETEARSFHIERIQFEKDGSAHVYVSLKGDKPSTSSRNRRVTVNVVSENGRYVVDDVVYINDAIYDNLKMKPTDRRLSEYFSAGCNGSHWGGYSLPNQPEAFVQSLYQHVVARRPVGIPWGTDWKIFAPYLSRTLLHRIDLAGACGEDWYRQNPDPNLKPEYGWLELGFFSNGDDEDELRNFQIDRMESEKNGSMHVYVRLTWGWAPEKPWISHVAVVLVQENGRWVVDDVIYLKDETQDVEGQLSESLSYGCDGPHWVGDKRNDPKQQR